MTDPSQAPTIINLEQIQSVIDQLDLFDLIAQGFIAYSKGEAVIPPVGELLFDKPPGDVHIKYGYIRSKPYYVIKIASGFYQNPLMGLPSSQGLNLLFDKSNGQLTSILLDQGFLTDVRTAVAGALATNALAPSITNRIAIVGAGIQARLQLQYHQKMMHFKEAIVWNRNHDKAQSLARELSTKVLPVSADKDLERVCRTSQVIVTTTPTSSFLVRQKWIQPGTHITAVGADTTEKNELEPALLAFAEVVVVDSLSQSQKRGEVFKARKDGFLKRKRISELGQVLVNKNLGRQSLQQISIADLTGVAVQDLMISHGVFEKLYPGKKR